MKKNFYSVHGDAFDTNGVKHIVTVVGELISGHETKEISWDADVTIDPEKNKVVPGKVSFTKKVLHRKLTLGSAICSPQDTFDETTGIKIAKSRIRKGEDCGILETNSVTMLTTDCVYSLLLNKLKWICDHIDMYIKNKGVEIELEMDEEETVNTPEAETPSVDPLTTDEEASNQETIDETLENKDSDTSFFDAVPSFEDLQKAFDRMNKAFKTAYHDVPKCCSKKCKKKSRKEEIYDDLDDFIFGY